MIHRAWLTALFLSALVAAARADDVTPTSLEAAARFEAGTAAYKAGDYARALVEFDAGLAIEAWPGFHFASAQAARRSGDCAAAIPRYQAFLKTSPPDRPRQLALEGIALCAGTAPPPIVVAPPPPPAPPPRLVVAPGFHHKLAVGLVAGGAALGVTAGVSYLLARREADAADTAPTYPATVAHNDRAEAYTWLARVSGGVGAVLVIGGVVRFATHAPPLVEAPVALRIGPGSVAIAGRF